MNKIHQYKVTPYPYKSPGFFEKILIGLKFKKAPIIFEIWINKELKESDVISNSTGDKYVVIKKL